MAEHTPRRTPLIDHVDRLAEVTRASGGTVTLAEVPFVTQLNLRLDPAGPAAEAVGKELGTALPTEPGTTAAAGDVTVLWLGPDEWLVLAPPGAEERLAAQLRSAAGGDPVSVVDVSAQRTTLAVGGTRFREVLAQGCALDLHPSVFAEGGCAQTTLAHTPVVLLRRDPEFRVLVRASFAAHLAEWLVDASVEFTT
jgi:sarcosine oxidase subunit gamma